MENVRCDVYEKVEEIINSKEISKEFQSTPSCEIDVFYTTELANDDFLVNIVFTATIKDGDVSVADIKAPYRLTYTLEKYKKYGKQKLVEGAFREMEMDGITRIMLMMDVFLFARIQTQEQTLN